MKIARIAVSHHALDLDPPFPAAWDPEPRWRFVATVVRVVTDDGLEGIGSGDAMPGFAGHEPLFVGRDPRDLDRHHRVIDNLSFHYGRCWPLDLALWDLFGKIAGQPCWRLLGGASPRLRLYASTGMHLPPRATVEVVEHARSCGFGAVKLRFGAADWRDDVARVEAVRARLGDAVTLLVDANQGWRMPWDASSPWTLKDAMAVARALEPLDVYWLEEPLHRADRDGMRALRQATGIRIAGGEMAREAHDLTGLIDGGCLDVLQPDAALVGGITGLRRIADHCRTKGLMFTPHTWGNGIGLLANAQLTAGCGAPCPFLEFPHDPPTWTPDRRDFILSRPVNADGDGHLTLPETPGLGIELDEERLAATRIG